MKPIGIVIMVTGFLLLIPFVAMQFWGAMAWTSSDFLTAGALIFASGLSYLVVTHKLPTKKQKVILALIILAVFAAVWVHLAAGIW